VAASHHGATQALLPPTAWCLPLQVVLAVLREHAANMPVQAACPGRLSSSKAGQFDATAVKAEGKVLARVPAAPRNHFLPEAAQPCLIISGAYRMTTVLLQPAGAFSPRKVGPWMTCFWPVGPAVNGPFSAAVMCMSSRWQGAVHHIRASVVEATRAAEPAHAAAKTNPALLQA